MNPPWTTVKISRQLALYVIGLSASCLHVVGGAGCGADGADVDRQGDVGGDDAVAASPVRGAIPAPDSNWMGARGISATVETTGPVVSVAFVASVNGAEAKRWSITDGPPWTFKLSPTDVAARDGDRVNVDVEVSGDDGQVANSSGAFWRVDLAGPQVGDVTPEDGAVLKGVDEVDEITFFVADLGAGLDPFETGLSLSFDAGDGVWGVLKEGTDYVRNTTEVGRLKVALSHPSEGRYRLELSPVDRLGNQAETTSVSVTVDGSPPSLQIVTPEDQALLVGTVDVNLTTADLTTLTTRVTLEDANGTRLSATAIDGLATLDTTALGDGPGTLHVVAVDQADHNASVQLGVTFDNSPPALALARTEPQRGGLVPPQIVLEVLAHDAGTEVTALAVNWPGAELAQAADRPDLWTGTLAALPHGSVPLEVEAVDGAGHRAALSIALNVDAEGPRAVLTPTPAPIPDPAPVPVRAPPAVTVALSDHDGVGVDMNGTAASVRLTVDGATMLRVSADDNGTYLGEIGAEASAATFALSIEEDVLGISIQAAASGQYRLSLTPVDHFGNTGQVAAAQWMVDRDPPQLVIARPTPGAIIAGDTLELGLGCAGDGQTLSVTVSDAAQHQAIGAATGGDGEHIIALGLGDLSDGPLAIVATYEDVAGNIAEASQGVVLDRLAPQLGTIDPPSGAWVPGVWQVSVAALDAVSGVALVEATINDGAHWSTLLVPVAGPVEAQGQLSAPAGPVEVQLEATDGAGHRAEMTVSYHVDTGPPTATISPEGGIVAGLDTMVMAFADTVGVGAAPDADSAGVDMATTLQSIVFTRDGLPIADASFEVDGAATTVRLPAVEEGTYILSVTPVDGVGNAGSTATATWVMDTTPPEISIISPSAGAWVGGGAVPVVVSASDLRGIGRVSVSLEGVNGLSETRALILPPFSTTLSTTGLANGPATLTITATDSLGNRATVARPVKIDNQGPSLTLRSPGPSAAVRAAFNVSFAATDAHSGVIRVEARRGSAYGPVAGTFAVASGVPNLDAELAVSGLSHGERVVYFVAVDMTGQRGVATRTFLVDDAEPWVESVPATGAGVLPGASITLTLMDGEQPWDSGVDMAAVMESLAVTLAGAPLGGEAIVVNEVTSTITIKTPDDGAGALGVSLTPTDLLGNTSSPASWVFILDGTPPTLVPPTSPADGATGVSGHVIIRMTFDEALDPESIDGADVQVMTSTVVPATVSLSEDGRVVNIDPDAWITPLTPVSVSLSGVSDLAGNTLEGTVQTQFVTGSDAFVNRLGAMGLGDYRGGTSESGENHGPGGTFADLNGDGYPELVLCTRDGEVHHLYVNTLGPDGGRTFSRDLDFLSDLKVGGVGAVVADFDNDGDRDVYIGNYDADNVLLSSQWAQTGELTFNDVTDATIPAGGGLSQRGVAVAWEDGRVLNLTMTGAWADVDRDGFVDLYVGSHNGFNGNPDKGQRPGERDTLYLNGGDGTFSDVTEAAGTYGWISSTGELTTSRQNYSSTNAVVFADLNDDRWPDLIVTNKLRSSVDRDMVYMNQGDDENGTWLGFSPITYDFDPPFGHTNPLSMGIALGDVDNDGDLDFYVTDWAPFGMVPGPNELWLNQFVETGQVKFVVGECCTGVYSWGAQMADFDNDGFMDIHTSTNGGMSDQLHSRSTASGAWGNLANTWSLAQTSQSRGDISADLDRNGWLDLFVVNLGAKGRLYQNWLWTGQDAVNHWLGVDLTGDPEYGGAYKSCRDAIGARVVVWADVDGDGSDDMLTRQITSGSGNAMSSSSLTAEFGLGSAKSVDINVQWPSGRDSWLIDVPVDLYLAIDEAETAIDAAQ